MFSIIDSISTYPLQISNLSDYHYLFTKSELRVVISVTSLNLTTLFLAG